MIIDHVGMSVPNLEQAKKFYSLVLAPLGIQILTEHKGWLGFGKEGKAEFWIGEEENPHPLMHLVFKAETNEIVDLFYAKALEAGGVSKASPKLRTDYYPAYYAAFIIDPNGYDIGVVNHDC